MADDFGFSVSDNGVHTEEDPAAAFLAQQENEIAVIENDSAGFGSLEDGGPPPEDTYTFIGGECVAPACLLSLYQKSFILSYCKIMIQCQSYT